MKVGAPWPEAPGVVIEPKKSGKGEFTAEQRRQSGDPGGQLSSARRAGYLETEMGVKSRLVTTLSIMPYSTPWSGLIM